MSQSDPLEKLKKGRTAAIELIPILRNKLASRDGSVHAGTIQPRPGRPEPACTGHSIPKVNCHLGLRSSPMK